ncbi:MAG: hypothetical protein ACRDPR_07830 [Nocardioidaceae bacterium]
MELEKQYVGIDLHPRRSVIVRRTPDGETLDTVRIDNDAIALAAELARPVSTPRSSSRPPTGGTGRPTCWPSAERTCTWRISLGNYPEVAVMPMSA